MGTDDVIRAAEAMGHQASDMIQVLKGVEAPSRESPLAGIARSALAKCQQIAEQVLYLSSEAAGQMRTFESSERRGRKLAETRLAAKNKRSSASGPTTSKQSTSVADDFGEDDPWKEEEYLWDDEL